MADDGSFLPNPVRALQEAGLFGGRSPLRRSFGTPLLTEAVIMCDRQEAFFLDEAVEFARLHGMTRQADGSYMRAAVVVPRQEWPAEVLSAEEFAAGFRMIRANLTDGSASLNGKDNDWAIAAAAAVSPKGTTRMDQNMGGGPQ